MKIFVTGATGYIGGAVAQALAQAGHTVYGLTRSGTKARDLSRCEIYPVIGTMDHPDTYSRFANQCQVLVHCAADFTEDFLALDQKGVELLLKIAHDARQPRRMVYTSGVWIYGNTDRGIVDESSTANPFPSLKMRLETEEMVLDANRSAVQTLVIRPGCVYGGRGGLTAAWFETAAKDGSAQIVGNGKNRWAMIHRDDLAQLYRRAIESSLRGEVFNATDRSRCTVYECAEAASVAAGAKGDVSQLAADVAAKKLGGLVNGLTLNQHVDSSKAARLLDWQPQHAGFVDGVQRYYQSWAAAQES